MKKIRDGFKLVERKKAEPYILGVGMAMLLLCGFFLNQVFGGGAMEITSSAFKDGGKIPTAYATQAAGGKNLSVPLSWKDVPAGTKSLALSIVDPHPIAHNWVHWLAIDVPPQATSLPEGASRKNMPAGAVELKNSFGEVGYGGPQPPKGSGKHPYVITLYSLNVEKLVDLGTDASLSDFKKALEGKVIQTATITGTYEK